MAFELSELSKKIGGEVGKKVGQQLDVIKKDSREEREVSLAERENLPPENLPVFEEGMKDYEADIAKSWGVAGEKDVVLSADKPVADKTEAFVDGSTAGVEEASPGSVELKEDKKDEELEKLSAEQIVKEEASKKEILEKKEKLTEAAKEYAQSSFAGEKLEKVRSFFGNILAGGKSREKDAIAKDIEKTKEILKSVLGEYCHYAFPGDDSEKAKKTQAFFTATEIKKELLKLREEENIAKMGQPRRWINEKAGQAFGWYQQLSPKKKIAVSAALFGAGTVGAVAGNVLVLSTAIAGGAAMRALGGAATVGAVDKLFDKLSDKFDKFLGEGNEEVFEDKMSLIRYNLDVKNLEVDKALDAYIDKSIKKSDRDKIFKYTLAGVLGAIVSSGAIGLAAKELFGMGMPTSSKGGAGLESKPGTQPKLPVQDALVGEAPVGGRLPVVGQPTTESLTVGEPSIVEKVAGVKIGGQVPEFQMESPKVGGDLHLEIGARGPEGAIIDHFKTNPDLAKGYGWDGKGSVEGWAHRVWLSSVEGALKDPEVIKELTEHKFPLTPEGYTEAMTRLGKGVVELQPQGEIKLVDVDYLDKLSHGTPGGSSANASTPAPGSPVPTPPGPEPVRLVNIDPAFQAMEKIKTGDLLREYNDATRNQILSNNGSNLADIHSSLKDSLSPIGHDLAGTPLEMEKQAKMVEELNNLIKAKSDVLPVNYEEMNYSDLIKDLQGKGVIEGQAVSSLEVKGPGISATQAVVEKATETPRSLSSLPLERSNLIKETVSSKSFSASQLIEKINAGNFSTEEFGRYYAENIKNTTGGQALSLGDNERMFKKTLNEAMTGTGNQRPMALRAINSMLERLKQGK